jgi:hypothetical protein
MSSPRIVLFALTAAAAIACAACAPRVAVRTTESSTADIGAFRTFHILAPPARRTDAPALTQSDPMLDNSITNRALRQDLRQALEGRGYAPARAGAADFLVAYYAGTKEKLDTTYWNPGPYRYSYRGYRNRWAWPYYGWAGPEVALARVDASTQGTVIVDLIDARTNQLAWRGQGVATVSDDPSEYARQLARAVDEVVKRLPARGAATASGG